MSEIEQASTNAVKDRQKQVGTWVAGIFVVLGLAFFIYDLYTVVFDQKGRFDLSDKVLMPVAAVMFLVAAASLFLIRRNHFFLGVGLLFYFYVLVPPVIAVLLLQGIATIAVLYIVLMASIQTTGNRRGCGCYRVVSGNRVLESRVSYRNRFGKFRLHRDSSCRPGNFGVLHSTSFCR